MGLFLGIFCSSLPEWLRAGDGRRYSFPSRILIFWIEYEKLFLKKSNYLLVYPFLERRKK